MRQKQIMIFNKLNYIESFKVVINLLFYYYFERLNSVLNTNNIYKKQLKNSKNVILHNIKEGFMLFLSNNIFIM